MIDVVAIERVVERELTKIKIELIDKYDSLGMRASGKWAENLEIEIISDGNTIKARILGLDYTRQLVFGRAPGSFPPIVEIENWIDNKGIVSDIPTEQLAFLIARKIKNFGTKWYQQGGTELVADVVTDARVEVLLAAVSEVVIFDTSQFLRSQLQRLAA